MSLILCSHLLRDVEEVCDEVIVFNQGKVAARGPIAALTGPRRSVYDVRVKGDAAAFLTDLKDLGCEWRESEDGYRVATLSSTHSPRAGSCEGREAIQKARDETWHLPPRSALPQRAGAASA